MVGMNVVSYLPQPILDIRLPLFFLTLNPIKCDLPVSVTPDIHGNSLRLTTVARRDQKLRDDEGRQQLQSRDSLSLRWRYSGFCGDKSDDTVGICPQKMNSSIEGLVGHVKEPTEYDGC